MLGTVLSCWCLADIMSPKLNIAKDRVGIVASIFIGERDIKSLAQVTQLLVAVRFTNVALPFLYSIEKMK